MGICKINNMLDSEYSKIIPSKQVLEFINKQKFILMLAPKNNMKPTKYLLNFDKPSTKMEDRVWWIFDTKGINSFNLVPYAENYKSTYETDWYVPFCKFDSNPKLDINNKDQILWLKYFGEYKDKRITNEDIAAKYNKSISYIYNILDKFRNKFIELIGNLIYYDYMINYGFESILQFKLSANATYCANSWLICHQKIIDCFGLYSKEYTKVVKLCKQLSLFDIDRWKLVYLSSMYKFHEMNFDDESKKLLEKFSNYIYNICIHVSEIDNSSLLVYTQSKNCFTCKRCGSRFAIYDE